MNVWSSGYCTEIIASGRNFNRYKPSHLLFYLRVEILFANFRQKFVDLSICAPSHSATTDWNHSQVNLTTSFFLSPFFSLFENSFLEIIKMPIPEITCFSFKVMIWEYFSIFFSTSIVLFPDCICRLKKLKVLHLHSNKLTILPNGLIFLNSLTELSLRDNPLVVRWVNVRSNNTNDHNTMFMIMENSTRVPGRG